MATLRTATTSSPALTSLFRFASQPSTTRQCSRCLRARQCPFSSYSRIRQSSKRPLMTETVRPQTLDSEIPPPPRNDGVPETSIAGIQSQPRQSQQKSWPSSAPWQRKDSGAAVAEPEFEAQKSKPTTTAQSTTPQAKKKSKLRPRKAPITLTQAAISQLHSLADSPESKMIRVGVKNRGCSGLAYHLEYVDTPGAFDEEVVQEGVKVLIDSKALFSIIGSEMDWVEDKLQARFIFRNPNITEQCGCGESFSIS